MNRRGFFNRLSKAVAGAALATHLSLGELVPVPSAEVFLPPEPSLNHVTEWHEWMVKKIAYTFAVPPELLKYDEVRSLVR